MSSSATRHKPGRPARMRDRIETAVRELVAAGKLRPDARDCEVFRLIGLHLRAQGCAEFMIPKERTFRRHVGGLRIMWLIQKNVA